MSKLNTALLGFIAGSAFMASSCREMTTNEHIENGNELTFEISKGMIVRSAQVSPDHNHVILNVDQYEYTPDGKTHTFETIQLQADPTGYVGLFSDQKDEHQNRIIMVNAAFGASLLSLESLPKQEKNELHAAQAKNILWRPHL